MTAVPTSPPSPELRLYSFVNFYLSPIQAGIQTGHASVDLMVKYAIDPKFKTGTSISEMPIKSQMVADWAMKHKTYIILNGGDSCNLNRINTIVKDSRYPYCEFFESQCALNGLKTCVSVVLPEEIFAAKVDSELTQRYIDSTPKNNLSDDKVYSFEFENNLDPLKRSKIFYRPGTPSHALIKLLRSSRLI